MSEFNRKIIVDAITRMLARREHSYMEITAKLTQKGYAESQVAPIIEEFREADIQSDQRFAEAMVRSALSKGRGPRRLSADLTRHDISESLVDAAVAEVEPDWFELALSVREKKFGLAEPSDFKRRQKQMQFLQYRGFLQAHIDYAMQGHKD
ncbi:regulatory protein RecX [Salinimonas chungwhensis]|uniref:regulatory protein RecX n=1 Tax=Salinimonas chungwhensis TaxID=265425 RepID=UPI00035CF5F6|nr:regulatory protein RecX [Salinimonas chungwhensis]